jgi:hypothetical protein
MGEHMASWLSGLCVLALGLTAGAMLAEAAILVPYWQSLPPGDFFDWYRANASLLVDFYSPLEISAAVGALACAIWYSVRSRPGAGLWWLAAALSIFVLVMFFLYFEEANAGFATRSISEASLATELATWGSWQWARVGFGCAAFAVGILALRMDRSAR